jgi:aminopeptidase-like protein
LNNISDSDFFPDPLDLYSLANRLFPICRSLTGPGVVETLQVLKSLLPELQIKSVPTGFKAYDWCVPNEWSVKDAYIIDPNGRKLCDFHECNLHLVGYSQPVSIQLSLDKLQPHLHSIPEQPSAVPYQTSYYAANWGFCIAHQERVCLPEGTYTVKINSELRPGRLHYGELLIRGKTKSEILLSTYICHPSMANNEVSGPVVTAYLSRYLLAKQSKLNYSYRIVFVPETIGSLVYIKINRRNMKRNVVAGYNITCVGDERQYSFLPARRDVTLSERVAIYVLERKKIDYIRYSWLDRGSDERQYCSPLIDLPIATISRSLYCNYPEYHTSLDTLNDVVTSKGLFDSFSLYVDILCALESNVIPKALSIGEPWLTRHALKSSLVADIANHRDILNILTYSDGDHDLVQISNLCSIPLSRAYELTSELARIKILRFKYPHIPDSGYFLLGSFLKTVCPFIQ